jgi:hypothetical protein
MQRLEKKGSKGSQKGKRTIGEGRKKDNSLVEPVPQHAPLGADPADLDALGAPAFLAVEDGERRPADLAFGGLSDGSWEDAPTGISIGYCDRRL